MIGGKAGRISKAGSGSEFGLLADDHLGADGDAVGLAQCDQREDRPREDPQVGPDGWEVFAPLVSGGAVVLERIEMSGEPDTIAEWLGTDHEVPLDGIRVEWVEDDEPGTGSFRPREDAALARLVAIGLGHLEARSRGGIASPTAFDSARAADAARRRWTLSKRRSDIPHMEKGATE